MRAGSVLSIRILALLATACCLAAAVVALTGGGTLQAGPVRLRSHDPLRPAFLALLFGAAAARRGTAALLDALAWPWTTLEKWGAAGAAMLGVLVVAAGVHWGAFVAGGSDSYCYLNQAELFARGAVHDYEPLAADLTWPGNLWSFVPAGHMPVGSPIPVLAPICPAGYPMIMALARTLGGREAMFWITPLMGGLTVWLMFALGRMLAGPAAGLLASVLAAVSPTFLYQLFQPMNDVTAAALWLAAIVAALRSHARGARGALIAGLLTAAALVVRPNLVPLAGIIGLAILLPGGERPMRERLPGGAAFAAAAAFGPLVVLLVQNAMYGSPFKSGYGDLGTLFSASHVLPNLQRYPRWVVETHTPLVLASLAAPFLVRSPQSRQPAWLLGVAVVTLACYLPYVVFDAWWYTRFLLPGLLPLLALTACAAAAALVRLPIAARFPVAVIFTGAFATAQLQSAAEHDVFRLRELEWRFRAAGEFAATLPANAAFITLHQSGSIRFYARRSTLGWADLDKGRLDDALAFLRRHGRKPYLLFEPWEEPQFRERFAADRLGALAWPAAYEIDGVRIYDPDDYDRRQQGEMLRTQRIESPR